MPSKKTAMHIPGRVFVFIFNWFCDETALKTGLDVDKTYLIQILFCNQKDHI